MTFELSRASRFVTIALVAATRIGLRKKSCKTASNSVVSVSNRNTSAENAPGNPRRALPRLRSTETVAEFTRRPIDLMPGTMPAISLNQ